MSDTPQATVAVVRFLKRWELYYANDMAAFPLATAEWLVKVGFAVRVPGY